MIRYGGMKLFVVYRAFREQALFKARVAAEEKYMRNIRKFLPILFLNKKYPSTSPLFSKYFLYPT